MEEVFINVKNLEIERLFKQDLVSVEDLVAELTEAMYEIEGLKDRVAELEGIYEQVD